MSFSAEIPAEFARWSDRPVAILGWGVSGRAVAGLCDRLDWAWLAFDEREGDGESVGRTFGAADLERVGLVVTSPGFRASHPWIALASRAGRPVIGELDFGACFWTGPAIAVTGTNGKTTLTELLAFALKRAGRDAVACGNNGYPLSSLHRIGSGHPVTAVVEVSSFQSVEMNRFSPAATLWTNFDEDHLDRHGDLASYFDAKLRLLARTKGPIFVGPTVAATAASLGRELPAATQVVSRAGVENWEMPEASAFAVGLQRENLALAAAWWSAAGLPLAELQSAAQAFGRRQHRLSLVAEVGGVSFWNDSKATNFHATRAALGEFDGRRVHWIGGGRAKGGDLAAFAAGIAPRIATAQVFGETAPVLATALASHGVPASVHDNLAAAVAASIVAAQPGDAVLLSPGFASFDQFHSYADRGLAFERLVNAHRSASLQPQLTP